jgi:hypothetical protein
MTKIKLLYNEKLDSCVSMSHSLKRDRNTETYLQSESAHKRLRSPILYDDELRNYPYSTDLWGEPCLSRWVRPPPLPGATSEQMLLLHECVAVAGKHVISRLAQQEPLYLVSSSQWTVPLKQGQRTTGMRCWLYVDNEQSSEKSSMAMLTVNHCWCKLKWYEPDGNCSYTYSFDVPGDRIAYIARDVLLSATPVIEEEKWRLYAQMHDETLHLSPKDQVELDTLFAKLRLFVDAQNASK